MPLINIPVHLQIDAKALAVESARALANQLGKIFGGGYVQAVRILIAAQVTTRVKASPEYQSLLTDNELRSHFGLVNAAPLVDAIIDGLVRPPNGLDITVDGPRVSGDRVEGSVTASILRTDFSEVLRLAEASFPSRGGPVNWLQWLLLEGDSVLVAGYNYLPGKRKSSRTGTGIMVRSSKKAWKVPMHTGTATDNWLTRSLTLFDRVMTDIMWQELLRRF